MTRQLASMVSLATMGVAVTLRFERRALRAFWESAVGCDDKTVGSCLCVGVLHLP